MIFVTKSISTRAREFNGTSRKILKACNHALHDNKFFIDAPLNLPARVELLNAIFSLLRPGTEPGGRIEVCDYGTSSLSAILATLSR